MTSSSDTARAGLSTPSALVALASAAASGAALLWTYQRYSSSYRRRRRPDPENDTLVGKGLVWSSIGGALNASMLYVGDRLHLYSTLRDMCREPNSSVTAIDVAHETGYNQRWIREWMAQQAAMGILQLLPGTGNDDASLRYRLPAATAEVLADPESSEYDISMVQTVPALVNRAKTMLPEAFSTGRGRPYDEPDVAEAIDRHHTNHVRDFFLPTVLPLAEGVKERLENCCQVCDLGCGAGILLVSLAKSFPNSTFHGYEVSQVAIEKAVTNIARSRLSNVYMHDANQKGESLRDFENKFDVALIYDVLHDSVNPLDLIRQVRTGLRSDGVFLVADIPALPTIRENLTQLDAPGTFLGFSMCLCMSCALSEDGGAGLGTLGFTVPVAKELLTKGGFSDVRVLAEDKNVRWFEVK